MVKTNLRSRDLRRVNHATGIGVAALRRAVARSARHRCTGPAWLLPARSWGPLGRLAAGARRFGDDGMQFQRCSCYGRVGSRVAVGRRRHAAAGHRALRRGGRGGRDRLRARGWNGRARARGRSFAVGAGPRRGRGLRASLRRDGRPGERRGGERRRGRGRDFVGQPVVRRGRAGKDDGRQVAHSRGRSRGGGGARRR